jgi:hypothetical protein
LSKREVTETNVRAEVAAQWRVLSIAAGVSNSAFRCEPHAPEGNRTDCRADVPNCTAAIFDAEEVTVQWHGTSDDLADLLDRLAK